MYTLKIMHFISTMKHLFSFFFGLKYNEGLESFYVLLIK